MPSIIDDPPLLLAWHPVPVLLLCPLKHTYRVPSPGYHHRYCGGSLSASTNHDISASTVGVHTRRLSQIECSNSSQCSRSSPSLPFAGSRSPKCSTEQASCSTLPLAAPHSQFAIPCTQISERPLTAALSVNVREILLAHLARQWS